MNLLNLYQQVLNEKYIQLKEETASYSYKRDGNILYIFFEWSNGATDWKNNFDFPAKPYRDMPNRWYVHRGFLKVWKVIEDKLAPFINDIQVKKIIIAGYSHGAALALLCHEYCKFNRPDIKENINGYGFGCPRVVFGFLKNSVKKRFDGFFVIRNKKDIVTHVPPVLFLFRHVGKLITIGEGKWNCFDAHRPENYLESLSNLQIKQQKNCHSQCRSCISNSTSLNF